MTITIERLTILFLLALLIWFGAAISRVGEYHHAATLRFCDEHVDIVKRNRCLNNTQTRMHSLGHLLYGLRILQGPE